MSAPEVGVGDLVEARLSSWPQGHFLRGSAFRSGNALLVGDMVVHWLDGAILDSDKQVTIVARAPRPFYVNHPRTEAVAGDVVRDADDDESDASWNSCGGRDWYTVSGGCLHRDALPKRLRLLVDGATGQIVPQEPSADRFYKVGDPPVPDSTVARCYGRQPDGPFVCSLGKNHRGVQHAASTGSSIVAVWPVTS